MKNKITAGKNFREFARSEIERSIPQRFSQQVSRTPQNLAIKTKKYQWTYTELERTAEGVARIVLDKCGGVQQRIALLLEHDAPAIAAILGVLKAGKTYVFLDPSYPRERLAYILEDSQTTAVVTNYQNWELAVELLPESMMLINIDEVDVAGDESRSQPEITPDQLAYILYTSGSTGRPKGVMQNHRNVLHFIRNYTNNLKITSDDKLTLLSSLCFDGAIVDIFAALLNGATLYPFDLKSEGLAPVPEYLRQSEITIYHSIPTVYRHWTNHLSETDCLPQMRSIVLGGEEVKPQDVEIYQQHFSENCILVNLMGSTESTISLLHFIDRQTEVGNKVPVGYPLEETEIILFDDNGQVTDLYGEIGIRSPYGALGYWRQPQRTDKVFLADPEGGNKRIYRTGDIGRLGPDGRIEFVGRKDFQVKLRGYRIELGEIEAVLAQHPQVKEAAVIAREDNPSEKRLVAYVVAKGSQPVISELRSFLKAKLPDYMIPAVLVILESLPLTPNGKVNRRALPAPELDSTSSAPFVPPETPAQELLANIYASVLGIEQVGIHDNFFELGGHSLFATQVISRLRETFAVEMPLRSILEAPTVAQLEAQLNRRSQNDRQLPIAPAILRVENSEKPLSFAQERLWFLHQLEAGNTSAYNMPSVWQLTGEFDINALEQSLREIIRRHEVLRTSFQSVRGVARLAIAPECQLTLAVIDLRELSGQSRSLQVQKLAEAFGKQPFDLEQAPLLRAKILQLEDQKHVLLLNVHHIAFDGWSRGILRQELSVIYQAFSSGKPSPLAELPIQYADYAAWQRQWLQGEVLETQLNYWKQQLVGELPVLELPLDYPRPRVQTYTGGKKSFQLSEELTSSLKELSRQEGVTLYMTLLAAFKVLLSRYSGQSDLIVGTPIANRDRTELEGLLGFFVNTLVLRTDLGGNPSFEELLGRVREVTLGAYAHKDMPFEKLVEQLQPERDLSRNPLFQVWFDMVNVPRRPLSLPGMTVENLSLGASQSKFDLTLYVLQTDHSIQLTLGYNAELFSSLRMSQLLEHYQYLLEQIVTSPEKKLSGFALLKTSQKHYLPLREQIAPGQGFREFALEEIERSIPERFAQQVRQYPQNLAIKTKNYQWTYTELERKASGVAGIVLNKCGGGEQRIALLLEHDAPAIAAILGVLKAGKTYVPLDPSYPRERLAYILSDSQATAVVTNNANRELAVELLRESMTLVNIDEVDVAGDGSRSQPEITPDQLAYILYTSGSTGRPKGVMQNHRNVLHFIRNYTNNLKITPNDRLTLLSSVSFDAAIVDIFAALLNGATLYPFDIKSEGLAPLPTYLQQSGITIYHSTPTVYWHFESHLTAADYLPQMRLIVLGGEEVKPKDVEIYQQHFSADCILVNLMGSTESTISLQYFIDRQTEVTNKVPVGYPLEETEIILFDDNGEVTDFYGEIGIRSPYLALGYWQQRKLTDKVFIADPEGGNKRIYRTGDIGRLGPDGRIEFLGRKDFQVKLRGYRIELPEIEAVLLQHPQVKEAVAIAREDIPGNKRLVAYVVAKGSQLVMSELRSFAKSKLPDYMIPAVFVILESLPLTPNGKVNRRALRAPELDTRLEASFVPPQTPAQELLANIYASVLRIERVGIYDNFFELGGHSLLATQVISRLRETFAVEMPLRSIFEAPTVAELEAQLNRRSQNDQQLPIAPAILRVENSEKPLSFAQERLWFLHQLEAGNTSAYNMPSVWQLTGELNIDALEQSLREIIRRHSVLGTSFQSVSGVARLAIAPECQLTVPVIDLRELSGQSRSLQVQKLAEAFGKQPFDLEQAPLLRAKILQLEDQKHVLLLNVHHIAFDGWSRGILRQELSVIYQAFSSGKPSPLAELPIQYADYAAWQRQWLQGEVLETQLNYWKQQLGGELPVLELPLDYPRPRVQTYTGGKKSFQLSEELTSSLKQLSRKEGVTLYMSLLAAFKVLLSRYSGQSDIIIGTPIANRDRTELEGLLGFFVNTLVLRTDLGGNPSFRELLGRVREVTLGAYAHKDMPFEKLVEQLQPERDLSRNPLFQVWFDMVNVPRRPLSLPGMTVENFSLGVAQSKFDLTLYVLQAHESIQLTLSYNAELFNSLRMSQLLEDYQYLLEQIVNLPQQRLSGFALLKTSQKHYLPLREQIAPGQGFREFALEEIERSIPERFAQQVRQYPQNLAIKTKNYQWTYTELERKASGVAGIVLNKCGGGEQRIALLLEHDAPAIAAILGVLKAGKTYVPLDPNYPRERLAYILEDSQATAIATNKGNRELAVELCPEAITIINIDSEDVTDDGSALKPEIAPDQLAYILYTSGSTGVPKGVMQNHRNVLHFIRNYTNNLKITATDRLTLLSSISFDAAIVDIFAALLNGATLYPFDLKSEGLAPLPTYLQQSGITIYHSTPTVFRHLKSHLTAADCLPQMRLIVLGGEEVKPQDVEIYLQHFSENCILVNLMGSTESTISLQYFIDRQTEVTNKVPVGYPLDETEIILFDDNGEVTDFYGEIGIRSPYLALGYWQQRKLTDKVFLADPEGGNKRIYRTGDIGRLGPDGRIEFLGRKDFQVKLRGYRIELPEIEAVLLQHAQVKEAVAIAREDIPGNKRLVAYVVAKGSQPVMSELRSFAKSKLPDYMIPAAFVILESLPLTPNGKVNRRALPAPDVSTQEVGEIPPRTTTELQLAQIWSEVLNIPSVGVRDNFFDLGGHSLLGLRLMGSIEQQFGMRLPLTTLFTEPTIESQGRLLSATPNTHSFSPLVPIRQTGSKPPFFCVHPRGGIVLCLADLARQLGMEQPFYALQSVGLNGEEQPLTRFEDMATSFIEAIQTVQPEGPYQLGGYCLGAKIVFEMAQQLSSLGHEISLLALIDPFSPFFFNRPKPDEAKLVTSFAGHLSRLFYKELPVSADELEQLGLEEKLIYIFKEGTKLQLLPPEIGLEQMRQLFAVYEANSLASYCYVPQPYSGRITIFSAEEKLERLAEEQIQGWSSLATGGINIHKIAGDHFSIIHSEALAKELGLYL